MRVLSNQPGPGFTVVGIGPRLPPAWHNSVVLQRGDNMCALASSRGALPDSALTFFLVSCVLHEIGNVIRASDDCQPIT